ncbi:phage tail protein, partial [Salmonella enterica subsp. enterica]|nr:phage tail protein [Salmonella enterica subsp. enterica serovar Java]ECJ1080705.1 phage tail protein [Salmonella enterica subsp. enterica serovar Javiana]EGQ4760731.1 phage tail protein [Salmonella enterica subsp. enterica serovar Javiana]EHH3778190.1 phage tail protein [Salmonella enterica subsp. enterica serovar Java]EIJ8098550.1 phage tail protein [Salmonella enterica]
MHRIDTPTAQKDKFGQGKNGFTNGDPATGRRATDLNSDMWDAVQEEVCTVIEAAGIPLSKGEHTQLHAAIGRLIAEQVKTRLEKNQNGADIPNKPLFLQNVGLGETINRAADALQKSQNGADIPDKPRFVQNIGLKETLNPTKRVS